MIVRSQTLAPIRCSRLKHRRFAVVDLPFPTETAMCRPSPVPLSTSSKISHMRRIVRPRSAVAGNSFPSETTFGRPLCCPTSPRSCAPHALACGSDQDRRWMAPRSHLKRGLSARLTCRPRPGPARLMHLLAGQTKIGSGGLVPVWNMLVVRSRPDLAPVLRGVKFGSD